MIKEHVVTNERAMAAVSTVTSDDISAIHPKNRHRQPLCAWVVYQKRQITVNGIFFSLLAAVSSNLGLQSTMSVGEWTEDRSQFKRAVFLQHR